jgi:hypothetical protein
MRRHPRFFLVLGGFCLSGCMSPAHHAALDRGCTILRAHSPTLSCKNLRVESKGDIWVIYPEWPGNMVGGGPTVELSKRTGRIVRIYISV